MLQLQRPVSLDQISPQDEKRKVEDLLQQFCKICMKAVTDVQGVHVSYLLWSTYVLEWLRGKVV